MVGQDEAHTPRTVGLTVVAESRGALRQSQEDASAMGGGDGADGVSRAACGPGRAAEQATRLAGVQPRLEGTATYDISSHSFRLLTGFWGDRVATHNDEHRCAGGGRERV